MTTAPGSPRLRWLGLAALLLAAGLVAGCTELGLDGEEEDPTGAPHAVTYEDVVSPVQVTNGKGGFVDASWRVPFEVEWRLVGSMQVFTDDARVIAVDEAIVTNMTNASAKRIVVDRASFTVLGNQVWIDEDQPAAEVTFEEGLRVDGDLETAEYEGSGQIEGSNLQLHAERAPIFTFTFTSPSRITVPDQGPGQATGIGVRTQNTTPAPLEIDGEGIPAPWEAWFTELDARVPAKRGQALQLAGSLVQAVREESPWFSCRLVLTGAEDPAHLGTIRVEGEGTSFNTTLVLEGTDETDIVRTLAFLDAPSSRPLHGQLIPAQSYPVEPPGEGRIERWDVRAPNCAVDDRRQKAS